MSIHPDIVSVFLVDAATGVVKLSATGNEGQYLGNRQFIKAAAAGETFFSGPARDGGQDLLYFAAPAGTAPGAAPMVVVMATKAEDLWEPLSKESNQLGEDSVAILTDEFGVRIGHSSDGGLVYKSWVPLAEETKKTLLEEQRYGADISDIGSTDFPEVAAALTNPLPPANITAHRLAISGQPYESGLVRSGLKPWVVMEAVPYSSFLSPTNRLVERLVLIIILEALVVVLMVLFASRILLKPIITLTSSVEAMSRGDMSTPVPNIVDREMGRLAQRFESLRRRVVQSSDALERGYLDLARALVASLEARDPYTGGHTERVGQYAMALARQMGLSDEDTSRIKKAADLHDIGKIGTPDAVLLKPGKLTPGEFAEIKRHPTKSGEIVHYLGFLRDLVPDIEGHHEHYDGTGYPRGLRGKSIPLGARILAVADAYDAMTSKRAYRDALNHERAVEILKRGAGAQWDPAVVTAFLETVKLDQTDPRDDFIPNV